MNKQLIALGVCGPTKIFKSATVQLTFYPADESICLVSDLGTPDQQVYTVCMIDHRAPLKENHVWLKGWGANEGAPEALQEAGLVKLTGAVWPAGHAEAQEAELLIPSWAHAGKQK